MLSSVVLYYHHVSDEPGDYTYVTPLELHRQLAWLSERFAPRTLDEIAGGASGFGVSFDDGYEDVLAALDVLDRLAVPATFFVLPAFAGGTSRFNRLGRPARHAARDDLRRLRSAGHAVGSHGVTHRDVTTIAPGEAESEFRESRALLEGLLEATVTAFAYPFGACDRPTAQACARWYAHAWSTSREKASRAASRTHAAPRAYLLADGNGDYALVR